MNKRIDIKAVEIRMQDPVITQPSVVQMRVV